MRARGDRGDGSAADRGSHAAIGRVLALTALLLLIPAGAAAQGDSADRLARSLEYGALQTQADAILPGLDVKEAVLALIRGEWTQAADIVGALRGVAFSGARQLAGAMAALLIPIGVLAIADAAVGERSAEAAAKICAVAVAAQTALLYAGCAETVSAAAERIGALAEGLAPVLATLVSASGGVTTAALLSPAAALLAQLSASVILRGTIPLIGCAAILAVCPAFSRRFSFGRLRGLLLGLCNWTHGLLVTGYLGLLTVRGLVGSGADSVSMHTARYTVDNLLPVVGGEIADTLDLLVASARLVRSGVGVTGLILLAYLCAKPIAAIVGRIVALRLCAAVAQPLGAQAADALLTGFSEVLTALCVALASAMTLFLLLVGAAAAVGNGVL